MVISSGMLDDITLFRFAHMYRKQSAGGVESYLNNLNRCLLERNRMRILQMYLAKRESPQEVEIEKIGRGEIAWIPSYCKWQPVSQETNVQKLWAKVRRRFIPEFRINHDLLISVLEKYRPELAAFHWLSEDSKIVVNYVNKYRIPFVVINHFHNARLKRSLIRQQIQRAVAIGGVSNVDVPDFIKSRFTDLSDGIDTEYYRLENAGILKMKFDEPIILMPSRVIEGKGHLDVVRALGCLVRSGLAAKVVFAGRVESEGLERQLKEIILVGGLEGSVHFVGELSIEDLRTWYGASDVVVLASYSEGLPRVLLEAQSMAKPVVAYNVGGVAEAFQDEVSGYLVKKGDIEGLAMRLKELLEDNDKRHQLGLRAREYVVARYSVRSLVDRHEKFYLEAIGKTVSHAV